MTPDDLVRTVCVCLCACTGAWVKGEKVVSGNEWRIKQTFKHHLFSQTHARTHARTGSQLIVTRPYLNTSPAPVYPRYSSGDVRSLTESVLHDMLRIATILALSSVPSVLRLGIYLPTKTRTSSTFLTERKNLSQRQTCCSRPCLGEFL